MDWFRLLARKRQTLRHLSKRERGALLQALVLFPLVAISLRLCGVARTKSMISRLSEEAPAPPPPASLAARIRETARMVQTAHRYNRPWSNCLKRSLVLWFLLRRQRIDADLRIGVQHGPQGLDAHAWLEYRGQILNDSDDVHERFAAFEPSILKCLS